MRPFSDAGPRKTVIIKAATKAGVCAVINAQHVRPALLLFAVHDSTNPIPLGISDRKSHSGRGSSGR